MFCRSIPYKAVVRAAGNLIREASFYLPEGVRKSLEEADPGGEGPGREALELIKKNIEAAGEGKVPLCQDTGLAFFYVRVGSSVVIEGGALEGALNEATAAMYTSLYLRKSVVESPLRRVNTGRNTPAVIHYEIVEGDELEIRFMAKGGGSENKSRMAMLTPHAGKEDVLRFVLETVQAAGPDPCPPLFLGVGLGGSFDTAPWLAKKALFRRPGERHPDAALADLEEEITHIVNLKSGVGIQGFGQGVTVLDTFIEEAPCHIASFPVAVNINCHSARYAGVVL
ncbi:MAG TPA: fumarate hydratase [Candidatus Mcinerneyibacteriales bacterium]|nr:fumarate hydratase [Candidatus Mcinerneyibacteriales bacterium]